jgi:antitoxin component of RelBE/YafQ-DinJ toxin-antitoxin module
MQEGYQIVELKNRVSDVLTQMSIKVSDVLTFLGQRCADSYQIGIRTTSEIKKYCRN